MPTLPAEALASPHTTDRPAFLTGYLSADLRVPVNLTLVHLPPHAPELMLTGGPLIGLAFDPHGGLALATSETVYRLNVPLKGLLPP